MNDNTRVTKAAGMVGMLTLLSRILGYIRDMVIAGFFGAGFFSDVFFAAFRIPNFTRRLFSEGALSIAFIPVFTRYMEMHGQEEAYAFARAAFRFLAIFLAVLVAAGLLCAPLIVYAIAPGFSVMQEKFALTVGLVQILLPYVYFIGLAGLCMGVLNVLGHFVAPALAPTLLNLTIISSMLMVSFVSADNTVRITVLAVSVIVGGGFQLLLQLIVLFKKGIGFFGRAPLFHPGIKEVARKIVPAIFGASVFQINVLLDTLLASFLAEGAISYLYYADRLIQFPLGIFAVSIATAVYPTLSRQAALMDTTAVRGTLTHALTLVFFVSLPSMIGLIILREPIIALLFKRGAFDAATTRLTASALLYYGIGIWAFAAVRIAVTVFYALNDAWTPVKAGIIAIGTNIILGILLMRSMSYDGLALATSLSSMLNLWLLTRALKRKIGRLGIPEIMLSTGRAIVCALAMGAVVQCMSPAGETDGVLLLFHVGGCILAGLLVYIALSYILNRETLLRAVAIVR